MPGVRPGGAQRALGDDQQRLGVEIGAAVDVEHRQRDHRLGRHRRVAADRPDRDVERPAAQPQRLVEPAAEEMRLRQLLDDRQQIGARLAVRRLLRRELPSEPRDDGLLGLAGTTGRARPATAHSATRRTMPESGVTPVAITAMPGLGPGLTIAPLWRTLERRRSLPSLTERRKGSHGRDPGGRLHASAADAAPERGLDLHVPGGARRPGHARDDEEPGELAGAGARGARQ